MFDVTARSSSSSPAPALCYSRWACRHGCRDVFSDERFLKNICNMMNLDEISRDICQFFDVEEACHNSTLLLKTIGRLAPFQFRGRDTNCDPFHVITGSHWLSCRVGNFTTQRQRPENTVALPTGGILYTYLNLFPEEKTKTSRMLFF